MNLRVRIETCERLIASSSLFPASHILLRCSSFLLQICNYPHPNSKVLVSRSSLHTPQFPFPTQYLFLDSHFLLPYSQFSSSYLPQPSSYFLPISSHFHPFLFSFFKVHTSHFEASFLLSLPFHFPASHFLFISFRLHFSLPTHHFLFPYSHFSLPIITSKFFVLTSYIPLYIYHFDLHTSLPTFIYISLLKILNYTLFLHVCLTSFFSLPIICF